MKKLIKPFLIILVCVVVVFIFSVVYGFVSPVPEEALLTKDVSGYKFQSGLILFCKLLFATLATGVATGFSWAFATEADPKKHLNSTFMLPQLKNVLIVTTVCTLLFVLAVDLIQPMAEMKQKAMLQDCENFHDYTSLAKEYERKGNNVNAAFYAKAAFSLNQKDEDAKKLAQDTELKRAEVVEVGILNEETKEEKLTSALDYLHKAQDAWNQNDFWNAHYYATCAEEISPRDDETLKAARELAASAWNKLSSYIEGVNANTEKIYTLKAEAYSYFVKGDVLQAYYAFKELREMYKKDEDIKRYFELSEKRLENLYFYTDEITDASSLEKYNNIRFTLANDLGGKDVYEIKGITVAGETGQLVQYLRDTLITTYNASGNVVRALRIPYAKMTADSAQAITDRLKDLFAIDESNMESKTFSDAVKKLDTGKQRMMEYQPFVLLESVDRNNDFEFLHIKPEWVVSDGSELPSYLLLDMPYDDFTLIRQASVGPDLMPLISLFKFAPKAEKYGSSTAAFQTSLILRLSLPLFVLALLLYMSVIGWGLRLEPDQPFKTRWILMIPLLGFVVYIAKDLMLYILKLLVYILSNQIPAWSLYAVIAAAFLTVLLTSIYFLNLRSE